MSKIAGMAASFGESPKETARPTDRSGGQPASPGKGKSRTSLRARNQGCAQHRLLGAEASGAHPPQPERSCLPVLLDDAVETALDDGAKRDSFPLGEFARLPQQ
ncbi:MAG TPA: hypothetical protein VGL35_11890 [Rhizomicrobium sp.]